VARLDLVDELLDHLPHATLGAPGGVEAPALDPGTPADRMNDAVVTLG
jgi:hypothetical protein